MPDPIKPDPTPLDHLTIPITLNLWQVNYLLKVLGKRPLEEVQGVFVAIQQQGNAAVAQATAPPPPPAEAAPPEDRPSQDRPGVEFRDGARHVPISISGSTGAFRETYAGISG